MPKKPKKLTLKQAAERLTAIVEDHIKDLPEEEQDLRVAMFSRSVTNANRHDKHDTPPARRRTAGSHR
jgi:hypothetical protein